MSDLRLKTYVGEHCVSTVNLKAAHSWADGDDYWYETYIFPANGKKITSWLEEWGDRYRTEAEALRGHERVCALVLSGVLPDAA